jgi:hypothetical protein
MGKLTKTSATGGFVDQIFEKLAQAGVDELAKIQPEEVYTEEREHIPLEGLSDVVNRLVMVATNAQTRGENIAPEDILTDLLELQTRLQEQ